MPDSWPKRLIQGMLQGGFGKPLSKSEVLRYLLEGTVDLKALPDSLLDGEDEEHDSSKCSTVTSSMSTSKCSLFLFLLVYHTQGK